MPLVKILLAALLLTNVNTLQAQIKAVTETGDQVLLADDRTWKYVEDIKNNDSTTINPTAFKKAATADFLLKSKITKTGIWLDSKKWNFIKSADGAAEYSFSLKENGSVGGMLVAESMGMDLKGLRKIALNNMQGVTSQLKIVREEMRSVNSLTVLMIQMSAVVQGIKINYITYFFTNAESTIQFICYLPTNMVDKYQGMAEEFLNGLVTLTEKEAAATGTLPNSSTLQSSMVANSNCKALFTGTWSYPANGRKYLDRVAANKIYETSEDKQFTTEYSITWLDKCRYQLRLLTSNDPAAKLIKVGAPILVEILNIDAGKMSFRLSYGQGQMQGEMTTIK